MSKKFTMEFVAYHSCFEDMLTEHIDADNWLLSQARRMAKTGSKDDFRSVIWNAVQGCTFDHAGTLANGKVVNRGALEIADKIIEYVMDNLDWCYLQGYYQDLQDDEEEGCSYCAGSGLGQYEGTICHACKGSGYANKEAV